MNIIIKTLTSIVAIALMLSINQAAAVDAVGLVDGEFQVSPNGAATYTIPIKVPEGPGGMQPELSLVYNSQSANGMLGVGWSLSGFSQITRCPKTLAQDGIVSNPKYEGSDVFCLDGERLIAVNGVYGVDGTEYRTEKDSFSKIVSYGMVGDGPEYFIIQTKDGLSKTYGRTLFQYSYINVNRNGVENRAVWGLEQIQDTEGNEIKFNYTPWSSFDSILYPNYITYTTNKNKPLYSRIYIRFNYYLRIDKVSGYFASTPNKTTNLLETISIKVGDKQTKKYILQYENTIDPAKRSLLKNIKECGWDANNQEICTPSTNFDWRQQSETAPESVDATQDNVWGSEGYSWTGDFNGDGKDDIATARGNIVTIKSFGGSYMDVVEDWTLPPDDTADANLKNPRWGSANTTFTGDFNGDGLTDIVTAITPSLSTNAFYTYLSTGNGFETKVQQVDYVISGATSFVNTGDINGDGLMDIVVAQDSSSWGGIVQYNYFYIYFSNGHGGFERSPMTIFSGSEGVQWGSTSYRWSGDFNGDGLTDIAQAKGGNVYMYLSTGDSKYFDFQTWTVPNAWGSSEYTWAGDFNGDGLTDIASASGTNVYLHISNSSGFDSYTRTVSNNWGQAKDTIAADFNGDGKTDIVTLKKGALSTISYYSWNVSYYYSTGIEFEQEQSTFLRWDLPTVSRWWGDFDGDGGIDSVSKISYFFIDFLKISQLPSQLRSITNGLGHKTTINYKPLTDSSVYTKGNGCSYPVQCEISAMQVVSSSSVEDGIGGTATYTYKYGDSRRHLRGRGGLGMGWMTTFDPATNLLTENVFDNYTAIDLYPIPGGFPDTFPYQGMNRQNYVKYMIGDVGNVLNYSQSTPSVRELVHPNQAKTYFAYVNNTYSLEKELPGGGAVVKSTVTTNEYDNFGNITKATIVAEEGGAGGDSHTSVTDSLYDNDTVKWHLGRLTSTTVNASITDTSGTRSETKKTTYGYYPDTGFLEWTIEEPDDPNLYLKTSYFYDSYGNKTEIQIEGASNAAHPIATRSTLKAPDGLPMYDYTGMSAATYTINTANAVGHTETKIIDARWGLANALTGPNGLTTTWEYDAFGRKIKETRADNTVTQWKYYWCNENPKCPTLGTYYITTITHRAGNEADTVSAPVTVYYDKLGRELRTETRNLNNKVVLKDILYNEFGKVWRTSKNYFEGTTPTYWDTYYYDALGREIQVTAADGAIAKTEYNGLQRTITQERSGENGYTVTYAKQTYNIQGKIAWTEDSKGNLTYYTYHPFGELETVSPPENGGAILSMTYDKRGRKLAMNDPDMGYWRYEYDALGNMRKQIDAKGQVVSMEYDLLNRMVQRTDQQFTEADISDDVIADWIYDSETGVDHGKSIGKLVKQVQSVNVYQGGTWEKIPMYTESITYDDLGRALSTATAFDRDPNNTSYTDWVQYTASTGYDLYGRVQTVTYPTSGSKGALVKKNEYDKYGNGYLTRVRGIDAESANKVFWEAMFTNADGHVTWENLGNNLTTTRSYDDATGYLKSIVTGAGTQTNIQNLTYSYDTLGNLESRTDHNQKLLGVKGVKESFEYDALNRLIYVSRNGVVSTRYQYDALGNIVFNSDVGYYAYGENGAGLHAVTSVKRVTQQGSVFPGDANADRYINSLDSTLTSNQILNNSGLITGGKPDCNEVSGVNVHDVVCISSKIGTANVGVNSYLYDANGNMYDGGGRSITYSSFNKPVSIIKGDLTIAFNYGPSRGRYIQTVSGAKAKTIHYANALFEVVEENGNIEYRNYITAGGKTVAVNTRYSNKASETLYIHGDNVGSADVITTASGVVHSRYSYSPFGKRRAAEWDDGFKITDPFLAQYTQKTARLFTGQEELPDVGLIHMNGRVYDPELGRFISADPFVQYQYDAQSYNRYSYVFNNPLSYSDPSGFFGLKTITNAIDRGLGKVSSFLKTYGRTIAAIAITAFVPGSPIVLGFISGLVASGGDLKAAVLGGITAGMFSAVGAMAAGWGNAAWAGAAKIFAHGMVGGVSSLMGGGKFKHGFLSASVTAGASVAGVFGSANVNNLSGKLQNAFKAALVGGTASVMSGGKFANGAITGAFSRMFNDLQHNFYAGFRKAWLEDFAKKYPVEHKLFRAYASNISIEYWPGNSNDFRYFESAWKGFASYVNEANIDAVHATYIEGLTSSHYGIESAVAAGLQAIGSFAGILIGAHSDYGTINVAIDYPKIATEVETLKQNGPQYVNEKTFHSIFGD